MRLSKAEIIVYLRRAKQIESCDIVYFKLEAIILMRFLVALLFLNDLCEGVTGKQAVTSTCGASMKGSSLFSCAANL